MSVEKGRVKPELLLSEDDADLIRTLTRSRLDSRGMSNAKPGLWFKALEEIERIVTTRRENE